MISEVLTLCASAPKGQDMVKAIKSNKDIKAMEEAEPKSALVDPYGAYGVMGVRGKPSTIGYPMLRKMAQVPVIAAIINTRLNQVATYAKRPYYDGDTGFKIVLKDRNKKMTEEQKKRAFEIEEFLLRTGYSNNRRRKDNFDTFIRKLTRDTLTIDALTFENVYNRKSELCEVWAIDAATIELVVNAPTAGYSIPVYQPVTARGLHDPGDIAYVQKIDGQTVAEYTEEELCFAIRNPRTDVYYTDFGYSELEMLVEIVTAIVNGIRYNTSYFSESHLPQGVLEIVGKYSDENLDAFRLHWQTMTSGASGKWAVPVMAMESGQGLKFTPFKQSNRDMEYTEFLEFLYNIACAVYQIDPNEVGFKSWTSGSSMSSSDNTKAKIDLSKDKGFIPLMQFLSNTLNSEIVQYIDPSGDFTFRWEGLNEEDEAAKINNYKLQLEAGITTVAEVRKKEDMEELLGEDGKPATWTIAPANSTLIQVYMGEVQAKQQEAQQQQQQQQAQQQQQQQTQVRNDDHKKQLELMDRQHKHNLEAKEHDSKFAEKQQAMNHAQQKDIAAMKSAGQSKGVPMQKSIELEPLEAVISWQEY